MAILLKLADSASWNSFAIALTVSVLMAGVALYMSGKQLFTMTKESIKQIRQVLGRTRPQLDYGHEKNHYGNVQRDHTIQVNHSASITWKAANHRYPCTSIVVIDGQCFQLSPEYTPQSPLAGLAESEKSPSSPIPAADGDAQYRGTTTSVSDGSTMELDSDINSSTDKHRLVSNVEFRSDKGKNNIDRVRNKEHEESEHEEGDDRRGTAENLGLIDLVGCGACDDDLREVGSKDPWPSDGDTQDQGMFQELRELEHGPFTKAQEDCEDCVIGDVAETPSEVMLWRLAANRSAVTEAMVDVILEVACSENNESYQKPSDSKRND